MARLLTEADCSRSTSLTNRGIREYPFVSDYLPYRFAGRLQGSAFRLIVFAFRESLLPLNLSCTVAMERHFRFSPESDQLRFRTGEPITNERCGGSDIN